MGEIDKTIAMCPRCAEYYKKYPLIEDKTDPISPKYHRLAENIRHGEVECALMDGKLSGKNWCCQTLLKLREVCDDREQRDRDDMDAGSFGWLRIPDSNYQQGYLVMAWYKDRGATDQVWVINEKGIEPLELETAEEIIKEYKK